jgi:TrpR family trp operon transcriptional repressor
MPKQSVDSQLASFLSVLGQKKEIQAVLGDLLTSAEREDLLLRLRIVQELLAGKTQREVAKKLGVSIAKVTRGAEALRNSKGGFSFLFGRGKIQ